MTLNYPTEVLHEDDALVIVNKPPGLLTLPDRFATGKANLLGDLTQKYGKIYVIHRLDRETSGIIMFAKTEAAHRKMSIDFEQREVDKIYLALVEGVTHLAEGEIDKAIGDHPTQAGKMAISSLGKPSLTLWRVKNRFKNFTLVEAKIMTGRTHQIRVHFQSIGYPLAIDAIYGRRNELFLTEIKQKKLHIGKNAEKQPLMSRTTLHAFRLAFNHPTTGERLEFEAPLHKDFQAVINQLQKWNA
jgi:23S rRNA pseudouridine1911/1915/1917 synthase